MQDADDQPLPPMSNDVLDHEQVAALFRDYRQCAQTVQIVIKPGPGFVPQGPSPTLDEVEPLLYEGRIRGLQIRYRFNESQWLDTLMIQPTGVRLIRIAHDPPAA